MRRRSLMQFALGSLVVAGCDSRQVPAPRGGPKRIVSVSPNLTEGVAHLGGMLVGRSQHCDFPASVLPLPSVGTFAAPNVERIASLSPSLVVGAQGPAGPQLAEQLQRIGIETWFPKTDSLDAVVAMLGELGRRIGKADAGIKASAALKMEIDVLRAKAQIKVRRALFALDCGPVVAVGATSFLHQVMAAAGLENVVTAPGAYPRITPEAVLNYKPDVVIDGTFGGKFARCTTLAELDAVRRGRVVRCARDEVMRAGPRIANGIRFLHLAVTATFAAKEVDAQP